jgi:hypothetical protein
MTLRELVAAAPDTVHLQRAERRPATKASLRLGLRFVFSKAELEALNPEFEERNGEAVALFVDEHGVLEVTQEPAVNGAFRFGLLRIRRQGDRCWRNFETLAGLHAVLECMTPLPF